MHLWEMQIKTTSRIILIYSVAKDPKFNNILYGEGLREKKCSSISHESYKLVQLLSGGTGQNKNYKCT